MYLLFWVRHLNIDLYFLNRSLIIYWLKKAFIGSHFPHGFYTNYRSNFKLQTQQTKHVLCKLINSTPVCHAHMFSDLARLVSTWLLNAHRESSHSSLTHILVQFLEMLYHSAHPRIVQVCFTIELSSKCLNDGAHDSGGVFVSTCFCSVCVFVSMKSKCTIYICELMMRDRRRVLCRKVPFVPPPPPALLRLLNPHWKQNSRRAFIAYRLQVPL